MSSNVKNSIVYSVGQYGHKFFSLFLGIITKRLLGPKIVGTITILSVISSYVDFLYAPIRAAVDREIPLLKASQGNKETGRHTDLLITSFSLILLNTILGSIVFLLFFLVSDNLHVRQGAFFLIFINVLKSLYLYFKIIHKTEKNFKHISSVFIFAGFIESVLTISLTYLFGYKGYFVGLLLGSIIMFVGFLKNLNFKFAFHIKKEEVKRIFLQGSPLVMFNFILINFNNIDKLMINHFWGTTQLGYYNIANMFLGTVMILPLSICGSYFPTFMEYLGKGEYALARQKIEKINTILSAALPAILGFVWIVIPITITLLLPNFVDSVKASQILVLGVYFNGLYQMHYYYSLGKRKNKGIIIVGALALIISVGLNYFAYIIFNTMEAIAIATVLSYAILSALIIYISIERPILIKAREIKSLLRNVFLAMPLILLLILDNLVKFDSILTKTLIMLLLFIIMEFPVFIWMVKKTKLIEVLRRKI